MRRDIITNRASSISKAEIDREVKSFIDKFSDEKTSSQQRSDLIKKVKKFVCSRYVSSKTRQLKFRIFRQAIVDANMFHHLYETTVYKITKLLPEISHVFEGTSQEIYNKKRIWLNDNKKDEVRSDNKNFKKAYSMVKKLKVFPQGYYTLKIDELESGVLADRQEERKNERNNDEVKIVKSDVLNAVSEGLESDSIYKNAVALSLCCGRRPIEIFKTASFEKVTETSVIFTGQAKDKGTGVQDGYEIPILFVDVDTFLSKFNEFRVRCNRNETKDGTPVKPFCDMTYVEINNRIGRSSSDATRRMINNQNITFYSCRAIYAEWCFVDSGVRSKNKYKASLLGHSPNDESTVSFYNVIELVDESYDVKPVVRRKAKSVGSCLNAKSVDSDSDQDSKAPVIKTTKRLKEFLKLNGEMNLRGKAIRGLHSWVCDQIAIEPKKEITQTWIRKNRPTNIKALREYMELIGELSTAQ